MVCLTLQPIFTHLSDVTFTSPSDDLRCMWSVLTKAKNSITQGHRLENLSWRLWYTSTKGFKKLLDENGNFSVIEESFRPRTFSSSKNNVESNLPIPSLVNQSIVPSNEKILHSLTNVLEEIRDSVPIKKNSKDSSVSTNSKPQIKSNGLCACSKKVLKASSSHSPPRQCMKPSTSYVTKKDKHVSRTSLGKIPFHSRTEMITTIPEIGPTDPISSIPPLSFNDSSPVGLYDHRHDKCVPKLDNRYSRYYTSNIRSTAELGLDEDLYKDDPLDPIQNVPVTTYPYDDSQFEAASKAFAAISSSESRKHKSEDESNHTNTTSSSKASIESLMSDLSCHSDFNKPNSPEDFHSMFPKIPHKPPMEGNCSDHLSLLSLLIHRNASSASISSSSITDSDESDSRTCSKRPLSSHQLLVNKSPLISNESTSRFTTHTENRTNDCKITGKQSTQLTPFDNDESYFIW